MNRAVAGLIAAVVLTISFYLLCLNYVDSTELGIARDSLNGQLWSQEKGWNCTAPWVRVVRIDTRPMRVGITTTGRGYDQKLVQFVPEAYKEFVEIEGFRYYWWANRFSFNFGYDDEYRGMKDILRGYAYSSKKYPFIKVLESYKESGH